MCTFLLPRAHMTYVTAAQLRNIIICLDGQMLSYISISIRDREKGR